MLIPEGYTISRGGTIGKSTSLLLVTTCRVFKRLTSLRFRKFTPGNLPEVAQPDNQIIRIDVDAVVKTIRDTLSR